MNDDVPNHSNGHSTMLNKTCRSNEETESERMNLILMEKSTVRYYIKCDPMCIAHLVGVI